MTKPTPEVAEAHLDLERILQAIETVEWNWMKNEGRFPAPLPDKYREGLRKQITAMSEAERRSGPMSDPKIAAEYNRLEEAAHD